MKHILEQLRRANITDVALLLDLFAIVVERKAHKNTLSPKKD
jgi:hypothetical protein